MITNTGRPRLKKYDEAWEYYKSGLSLTQIAKIYSCSVSTLSRGFDRRGYKLRFGTKKKVD